jgi:hypothetical protein
MNLFNWSCENFQTRSFGRMQSDLSLSFKISIYLIIYLLIYFGDSKVMDCFSLITMQKESQKLRRATSIKTTRYMIDHRYSIFFITFLSTEEHIILSAGTMHPFSANNFIKECYTTSLNIT